MEMLKLKNDETTAFLGKLEALYASMDAAYDAAAGHYGFNCTGCSDNCCLTRFYHHTRLEFYLLREGFLSLDRETRRAVRARAREVERKSAEKERKGEAIRLLCPLNSEGLCILYSRRPMICRMHGIPHELRRPGSSPVRGPGCDAFDECCGDKPYREFDRTPFYVEMARLEKEFRLLVDDREKFRKTVAGMLLEM